MLESPTMMWSRRYFSASAWGSSRVLMMLRDEVVDDDVFSWMCWARWEMKSWALPGTLRNRTAPGKIYRGTRKVMSDTVTFHKSTFLRIRKSHLQPYVLATVSRLSY